MSHPVQKTDQEWQMQLNKGKSAVSTRRLRSVL
jgi:hypothetical protein